MWVSKNNRTYDLIRDRISTRDFKPGEKERIRHYEKLRFERDINSAYNAVVSSQKRSGPGGI